MERINYASTFRTLSKKNIKYTHGVDTIIYMNQIEELKIREMISFATALTVNTNVQYTDLGDGLQGYWEVGSTNCGFYYTLHICNDEFFFPAAQIYLDVNKRTVKTSLYGLFFRFCKIYEMNRQTFLPKIDYFKIGLKTISRLDYAFDFFELTPEKFLKFFKQNKKNREGLNNRNYNMYGTRNGLQTRYIGYKGSKFAFFRLYDKTIDNKKKKKDMFYFDYGQTTRLEGQFGSNFVKGLTYNQIIQKVFSYMGIDDLRQDNYFVGKRYDPNVIANIKTFLEAWKRSTKKLMAYGYDLRPACTEVNEEQPIYNIRINKKKEIPR